MSKLLPTRLPLAQKETVDADTFNRLVRILEINLDAQDPDLVKSFNDGTEFRNLYEHQTYLTGLSGSLSLGSVTVTIT